MTLSDRQWKAIEPMLPGRDGLRGRSGRNNRMSLEGILWVMRTGAPWRDLPRKFGNWNTTHHRFRRWARKGVFSKIFDGSKEDVNLQSVMIDGTFAKVHQHGTGAKRGCSPEESARRQAIGRTKGGLNTKLMAMVDNNGRLIRFTVRPGNVGEAPELPPLLEGLDAGELIADKAYDSDSIRLLLASQQIVATIPPKSNRKTQFWYDPVRYRTRHLVENLFADLKQFRGIATRYCKLKQSYESFIYLASWIIETRPSCRWAKDPVYKKDGRMPPLNSQLALAGYSS